ncbi:Oidioi.mRNA.OKI2018_I69.chr1.g3565.t1.cds [Oikopleura dioica]|uniref:Oidioi.mRNA.OKI2018_I69.chr1.g3565.t1.cds n=1 Tax=Oikopleura dioica TaxID=34765 RepID=A0ABN7T1C1_OIKDI|nr:Oidioi.mRNA.OKI2018_I69.chr1.g3565.t1.cds [Oikopleura dioica]
MKLLSTFVAVSNAWSLGSCTTNGTAVDSDVTCRNSCDFDWIGRGPKVGYNELGKHENGFLASLNPQKWRFDYLNKDGAYVGVLRFDRTFCKRPILKAIGAGRINIEVFDRTEENYMTEAQYWEIPEDGSVNKEAAFVQFRKSGYQAGEFVKKGKDRFMVSMTGIQSEFAPLDPPNDNVVYDDYYECFQNVGLMTMPDDGKGMLDSDYTRCAAFQRYGKGAIDRLTINLNTN